MSTFTPWPDELAQQYREAGYWQGETFPVWFARRATQFAEQTAIVCQRERLSWRELASEVEQLAARLIASGLQPGAHVVVQLPNSTRLVVAFLALQRLGAKPVLSLPSHRAFELTQFVAQLDAQAYICCDKHAGFDFRTLARTLREANPKLQVFVDGDAAEFAPLSHPNISADLPAVPADASAVAFFQLSGGSTGTPKLIPRTHDDYLYSVRASAEICGLSAQTRYLCVLPAGHNFAMSSPGWLGVLHAGGTVVMSESPSPECAFPWIESERITMTALVPPLVPVWLQAGSTRATPTLGLVQVGGARLDEVVARELVTKLGVTLQQVFGMAEGLVNYTRLDDPLEQVCATQGRPISPADEVLVVDDDDLPVARGEAGHLLTRGPYTIRGYYRADAHNARAFTADGYYRSGDLVRQLDSGDLIVVGRAKDQINRGGEKISAEEVEGLLREHEQVADCALVGFADPALGEKSCAFVLRHGDTLRSVDLARYLRGRGIAAYKIPDRFEFVTELPATAVGKIDKKHLRQLLQR
ncbi:(2,3-dihydroxybenzoyl)adenylate synthase [Chitinibacteraceae bacterium HSL-7]